MPAVGVPLVDRLDGIGRLLVVRDEAQVRIGGWLIMVVHAGRTSREIRHLTDNG